MNDDKIPIHWLHSHAYCEYQIYLEHVKGIKVAPTLEMKKGRDVHAVLEKEHKEKAELELPTVTDAIEKAMREKITLIGREIFVEGNSLYGLIDEIHFSPTQIVIIDDKPNSYPFLNNKKQVWGYCLAFQEQIDMSDLPLSLIACLRQRDNQKIIWEENFSDAHKNIVLGSVEKIIGILNESRKAEPSDNIKKCKSCKFRYVCDMVKI